MITKTKYTDPLMQSNHDFRYLIVQQAILLPCHFDFYLRIPHTISPKFDPITTPAKESDDSRNVIAILKPAFRTDENRLGVVSLFPMGLQPILSGNPVCPKSAKLTLATILN